MTQLEKYTKAKIDIQKDILGTRMTARIASPVKEHKGLNRDILIYIADKKVACIYIGKAEYKLYLYDYNMLKSSDLNYEEKTGGHFHRFDTYSDCITELLYTYSKIG